MAEDKIVDEKVSLDEHFDNINKGVKETVTAAEGGEIDWEGVQISLALLQVRCLVDIAGSLRKIANPQPPNPFEGGY